MIGSTQGVIRGCGTRTAGGIYLEVNVSPYGNKPLIDFVLDPPLPMQADCAVGVSLQKCKDTTMVINHVGSSHYPNATDFWVEGLKHGFSRRVSANLDFSRIQLGSRILFIHDRGLVTNPEDLRPYVSVQPPVATIDPELEAGTDMLEYFYETNAERRQMMEDAFAIIQANEPETAPEVGEIAVDVERSGGYNKAAPTNEMYQQCQEQLSSSSIASLLTNGSVDIGGPGEGDMQPVPEGEQNAGQITPLLAENACYEYAEPTGLTTMIMEPTYVNELIGGYYQAYELADDYGS